MAKVRTGSGKLLPSIKSSYHDQYNDPSERELWPTPRGGVDSRAISRFEDFEDRLQAQEITTKSLIDRAYKIKEDIIDNLNITHSTWQEEKRNRELLQEHIRTITDVVRKLNRDINSIEGEIKQKETVIGGTQDNVKTLEMHHVAGLTDVRGRVARCDAAIARLSSDLKGCFDSVRMQGNQQQENNSRMLERLGRIDSKISELFTRLEKTNTETEINMKHLQSDTGQKVTGLDGKTRMLIEEMRNNLHSFKAGEAAEREKLESRLANYVEKTIDERDARLNKFEKQTLDSVSVLDRHLTQYDESFRKEREKTSNAIKSLETRIFAAFDHQDKKVSQEVGKLKRECREGFSTVHESITNMKQVMDGKRKLLEEQLRKEIGQIRKMVVLI